MADETQHGVADDRDEGAEQEDRPYARGVERHGSGHEHGGDADLDLAEVLPQHGAEERGGHRDLERAQHGGQGGDEAHLAQLRESRAAVDAHDIERRAVGGLEAEERADDGREEHRQGGEEDRGLRRVARALRAAQDDEGERPDRDDGDAVGDDGDLGEHSLEPRQHDDERGERESETVAPQVADGRLVERHGERLHEEPDAVVEERLQHLRGRRHGGVRATVPRAEEQGGDDPPHGDERDHTDGAHRPQGQPEASHRHSSMAELPAPNSRSEAWST
jgi:hypothetical protein